jgi:26S proteasome regulatory subunit N12
VLVGTIRNEIAGCSETAYQSLPISNAKNLLFLDSEGSVAQFAHERGWTLKDGRIYFPAQADAVAPAPGAPGTVEPIQAGHRPEKEIVLSSGTVIQNTIGYARELETIV